MTLGENLQYTSEPFRVPGSDVDERFICRFPTVEERDAYWNAVEGTRDDKGNVRARDFMRASVVAVAPLVIGIETPSKGVVNDVTADEVLAAAPYHEVLVAIATTLFRGASFTSAAGAGEDS